MREKTGKTIRRYLSLLLAAVMLITMQGLPVLAETAGQRAVNANTAGGRELPKNPVHHCTKENDGTDTTDWSYVWFGSYPQTEITGDALTTAITGASYDSNGDAWVDGIKYRRASKSDTNNTGYFGSSEYRYFKWERIKWKVLQNNGSTLFVAADKGLDCKNYNEKYTSVTWENCTLRNWMNNDFYSTAFSGGEQGAIVEQTVVNKDNPVYGTEGGNDTRDKVFSLSIDEVLSPDYGFCEDYDTDSVSRRVKASDYAHAMGAYIDTSAFYRGNSLWRLRSPGSSTDYAADVIDSGYVNRIGGCVNTVNSACVPALHINIASDAWSNADGSNNSTDTNADGSNNSTDTNAEESESTPDKTSISGKIRAKSKAFTLKWKKQKSVTGYQVQYSTSKKFAKKKTQTKTIKKASKTSLTVKKLKAKKTYYVRIRTYKTVKGKKYYSAWSKVKNVKTKK